MIATIANWLKAKWIPQDENALATAYGATFSTDTGRMVLQDLVDKVYCTIYEGTDPNAALAHNYRRTVVHEILENVDRAEHPEKYAAVQPEQPQDELYAQFRAIGEGRWQE